MHPDEVATIRAFFVPSRQTRWLEKLASARQRRQFLDRLNHCRDIDRRYATSLPSTADVVATLRWRGAPVMCRVTSDVAALDDRELPLDQAIDRAELAGFATLLCCVPGRLAYFSDERGARRRLLLERD